MKAIWPPSGVQGDDFDAQLSGKLSHALPYGSTYPPFFIIPQHIAATTHCSPPLSSLVVGNARSGEAPSFLSEGAPFSPLVSDFQPALTAVPRTQTAPLARADFPYKDSSGQISCLPNSIIGIWLHLYLVIDGWRIKLVAWDLMGLLIHKLATSLRSWLSMRVDR